MDFGDMGFTSTRSFDVLDTRGTTTDSDESGRLTKVLTRSRKTPDIERMPDGRPLHAVTAAMCDSMGVVAKSLRMRRLYATVVRASATPRTTVLIQGPSGSGKELVAQMLHTASARSKGPFMAVNCAALPESLLESELFGHEKGAFSGASERKKGLFEAADRGTLFLDEIGEMGPNLQAKLLRALQERSFRRIGGLESVSVDVRVVAATNKDLAAEVARGTFRADLYYRLHVINVAVPALAERPTDILPMAQAFLATMSREMGAPARKLSKSARLALRAHAWPGNVRELKNCVERAVALANGPVIRASDLGLKTSSKSATSSAVMTALTATTATTVRTVDGTLEDVERAHLMRVLEKCHGNQSRAAAELGIHRTTLAKKIRDMGMH